MCTEVAQKSLTIILIKNVQATERARYLYKAGEHAFSFDLIRLFSNPDIQLHRELLKQEVLPTGAP